MDKKITKKIDTEKMTIQNNLIKMNFLKISMGVLGTFKDK